MHMYETLPLHTNTIHPDAQHEINCITIDSDFRKLIPSITDEERMQLERNIIEAGGVRDPLTLWLRSDDDWVILDGHNRFEICQRLKLPFVYHEVEFDTREEAEDWIDRNQLGRRNLSSHGRKILLGRVYARAKKSDHDGGKGKKRSGGQNAHHSEKTSERIAREHGVDEKTVRRAAKFQQAAATLGIEHEITSGEIKATEAAVVAAAAVLPENPSPEQVEHARDKVGKKQQVPKPTPAAKAGSSRAKNGRLAQRITVDLIRVRSAVEELSETDSTYRDAALHELQSCIGHLSRVSTAAPAKSEKSRDSNELRAAVTKRWEAMRLWQKHWGIADMSDVRRLFIELIRDEQEKVGK
jgi:hypothetical protein